MESSLTIRLLEEKLKEYSVKIDNLKYEVDSKFKRGGYCSFSTTEDININKKDEERFIDLLYSYLPEESSKVSKELLTLTRDGNIVSINNLTKLEVADRDGYILTSELYKLYYEPIYYSIESTRWFLYDSDRILESDYIVEAIGSNKIILVKKHKDNVDCEDINFACVKYLRPYMKKDRRFCITLGREDPKDKIHWFLTGCYAKEIEFIEIFNHKGDIKNGYTDAIMIEWKD